MNDLNLRIDDEEKIRDIIENPVGIVILGSKSWAKASVVNELLGYALLPVNDHPDHSSSSEVISSSNHAFLEQRSSLHEVVTGGSEGTPSLTSSGITSASSILTSSTETTQSTTQSRTSFSAFEPLMSSQVSPASKDNWRAIRMMYGPQTQVSLAVSNYELVDMGYDRLWTPTAWSGSTTGLPGHSDLEINFNLWRETQSPSDPGYCSATLEIKLPHHLLAEDTQIIVAPTLSSGHVNFETIYHTCFDGVSPVVVYALSDADSLTSQEVDDLMELQRISPRVPVFFIRTHRPISQTQEKVVTSNNPGCNSSNLFPDHLSLNSASELTESQQHLLFSSQVHQTNIDIRGMKGSQNHFSSLSPQSKSMIPTLQSPSSCDSPCMDSSERNDPLDSAGGSSMTLQTEASSVTSNSTLIHGQHVTENGSTDTTSWFSNATLFQQLTSLGFLSPVKVSSNNDMIASSSSSNVTSGATSTSSLRRVKKNKLKDGLVSSELVENFDNFPCILTFIRQVLQSHLVRAANTLNALHNRCLKVFILTAFDMSRDMMITPKRINYAREKEQQLFDSLMSIANKKQEEIRQMINDTLSGMRSDLLQEVAFYQFKNPLPSNVISFSTRMPAGINSLAMIDGNCCPIGESLNRETALSHGISSPSTSSSLNVSGYEGSASLITSNGASQDSSESSPENNNSRPTMTVMTRSVSHKDYQAALTEIQDFVLSHLNAAIAGKLIGSVDCLRDSYVGTLERCLESLEKVMVIDSKEGSLAGSPCASSSSLHPHPHIKGFHAHLSLHQSRLEASNALKSTLDAAYQVEINMKTTSSFLRIFWEKIKSIVSSSMIWAHQPLIDVEWKIRVASDILDSLSESRLAKSICSQFRDRLKMSHENFLTAIKQLESVHSMRLEKTEEHRLKVRKVYAPKIARYALESTSLRDLILHGMPQLGREIGRGQYGVVYACDSWGGHSPVALKSVVPPDDKHWNDLAMEFYYTRSIPDHERIVQIRGSVIDHSYGGGSSPAVLLIMDRLTRDLYSAIKNGLDWLSRLQVAIDVVQGIRFLHSQGLVHRDIKLKNVLLDKRNRAKITDLGFCKPEAMMSGSIVGTPIHMAPELFSGKYDASVDVYAFGILFWYICAGHVRLPYIFEQCQNKDQLWTCVKKGKRDDDREIPFYSPFILL